MKQSGGERQGQSLSKGVEEAGQPRRLTTGVRSCMGSQEGRKRESQVSVLYLVFENTLSS